MGNVLWKRKVETNKNFRYLIRVCSLSLFLFLFGFFVYSKISFLFGYIGGVVFFLMSGISTHFALKKGANIRKNLFWGLSFRFSFLLIYSVGTISILKINPLPFGLGIFIPQIALFLYELYLLSKTKF